jgi:hypothetical protein
MIFGNGKFVCLLLLYDDGVRKMREMEWRVSDFCVVLVACGDEVLF